MSDPIILVTGASSGIGAAVCRRLARPGTRLLVHARGGINGDQHEPLESFASELIAQGAVVRTVFSDLSKPGAAGALVETAIDSFGGLDQIVSNAGFADRRLFGSVDRATLDQSFAAMAGAFFDIATSAMNALTRSECARVVAISSFAAHHYTPQTLFPVTAAAKAAVEALAKSLAVQLGPQGVTVNCVVPGYTRKDPTAHRAISKTALAEAAKRAVTERIALPDEIASLVQYLLSDDARQITGQTIHVDGGLQIS